MIVCLICPLGAAIVDRMAVIVGQQTITQLQLDEEIRVTALLNKRPVARQSRYPLPSEQDVNQYVEQIRTQNGGQAGLAKALATHDLTESSLRQHLESQLVALRFIEYRFQPDAAVSDEDIEAAYRRQASDKKTPRESIRAMLSEERTDTALNAWLAETRRQINIVYLDKSLQ